MSKTLSPRTIIIVLACAGILMAAAGPAVAATEHPYNLGCKALAAGDVAKAKTLFGQALKLDPTDTDALNNLAVCYMMTKDYGKALPLLQKVLRLNKRYRGADLNLGAAYMFQGSPSDAAAAAARASAAGSNAVGKRVKAAAYLNLGLVAAQQGRLDDAKTAFQQSAATAPSAQAEIALACAYCALGDFGQGFPIFGKLAQPGANAKIAQLASSDLAVAYFQRGMARLERRDLDAARSDFVQSTEIAANDYAKLGLALIDAERGNLRAAATALAEIRDSNASPQLRSAAVENLKRLKAMAEGDSRWLKLLILVGGGILFAWQYYSLMHAVRARPHRGTLGALQVVLGSVVGIGVGVGLALAYFDPFRNPLWVLPLAAIDAVVVVLMWFGATASSQAGQRESSTEVSAAR